MAVTGFCQCKIGSNLPQKVVISSVTEVLPQLPWKFGQNWFILREVSSNMFGKVKVMVFVPSMFGRCIWRFFQDCWCSQGRITGGLWYWLYLMLWWSRWERLMGMNISMSCWEDKDRTRCMQLILWGEVNMTLQNKIQIVLTTIPWNCEMSHPVNGLHHCYCHCHCCDCYSHW